MPNFNRDYRLLLGESGELGREIKPPIRVVFQIKKDDTENLNQYQVNVYNISRDLRESWQDPDTLAILKAGYSEANGPVTVCLGNVTSSIDTFDDGDVMTQIKFQDGQVAVRDTALSLSYGSGISSTSIIKSIVGSMQLGLDMQTSKSRTWAHGFSFYGSAAQALHKVCRAVGLQWSIQNNTVQIIEQNATTQNVHLVNAQSGMLGYPHKMTDAAKQKIASNEKISGDNQAIVSSLQQKKGYKVRSLLLPSVNPGDAVQIESKIVEGLYKVSSLKHFGDWGGGGDWLTELDVIEI